jgi:hypothetical protein
VDAPDSSGAPVAGATVRVRAADGTRYDTDKAGDDGGFRVHAPRGDTIHLEIEAEDAVTSSFLGVSGFLDVLRIPEGAVWSLPAEEYDAWVAQFAGCPDVDTSGSAVFGEVRVFDIVDPVTGEHPLVLTGQVELFDAAGEPVGTVCMLDDEGVYDPEAVVTGLTGRFAAFGLPAGLGALVVSWEPAPGESIKAAYPIYLPQDGAAPRIPLYVSLPL